MSPSKTRCSYPCWGTPTTPCGGAVVAVITILPEHQGVPGPHGVCVVHLRKTQRMYSRAFPPTQAVEIKRGAIEKAEQGRRGE